MITTATMVGTLNAVRSANTAEGNDDRLHLAVSGLVCLTYASDDLIYDAIFYWKDHHDSMPVKMQKFLARARRATFVLKHLDANAEDCISPDNTKTQLDVTNALETLIYRIEEDELIDALPTVPSKLYATLTRRLEEIEVQWRHVETRLYVPIDRTEKSAVTAAALRLNSFARSDSGLLLSGFGGLTSSEKARLLEKLSLVTKAMTRSG